MAKCFLIDCNKEVHAKHLCSSHYNRMKRVTVPEITRGYSKKYRNNNKQKIKIMQTNWRIKNHEHVNNKRREWHKRNKLKINQRKRELYKLNPSYKIKTMQWRKNNPDKVKLIEERFRPKKLAYQKVHNQLESVKEMKKRYEINHPRSRARGNHSLELEIAMNRVRIRDENTCQWQGCGLTYKDITIHVHHIFPRSEYPELELIENYMICYCDYHHGLWHQYRGDNVHHLYKKMIVLKEKYL